MDMRDLAHSIIHATLIMTRTRDIVQVDAGAAVSACELAAALAAHPGVEYAHRDRLVATQRGAARALRAGGGRLVAPAVNDPAWPAQWDKRAIGLTPRPDTEALWPAGAALLLVQGLTCVVTRVLVSETGARLGARCGPTCRRSGPPARSR